MPDTVFAHETHIKTFIVYILLRNKDKDFGRGQNDEKATLMAAMNRFNVKPLGMYIQGPLAVIIKCIQKYY
jgi:hypothetical protein